VPQVEPDFSTILRALDVAGVRYVLIGGLAMIAHGSAHVTVDVDISYSRDPDNLDRVTAALQPHFPALRGAPEGLPFVLDSRTLRNVANLTLSTDAGDLDLLAEPAGIRSFEELWRNSVPMDLFGITVRVACLDDLIAMKEAAGRPKDRSHILELLALKRMVQEQHDKNE
jgi:predicted nucleotidyltransferase